MKHCQTTKNKLIHKLYRKTWIIENTHNVKRYFSNDINTHINKTREKMKQCEKTEELMRKINNGKI